MFKATRRLIELRQPHSVAVIEQVAVHKIEGGQPRQCFENACSVYDSDPSFKIVSGWYVNRWNKDAGNCLIVAHYWNVDAQGIYVDCSPMDDTEGEYVIDSEIGVFASQNSDRLLSNVCSSIILANDKILGVDFRELGKEYRVFENLSNECLFSEYKSPSL